MLTKTRMYVKLSIKSVTDPNDESYPSEINLEFQLLSTQEKDTKPAKIIKYLNNHVYLKRLILAKFDSDDRNRPEKTREYYAFQGEHA